MFNQITLLDYKRPLRERLESRKYCGPRGAALYILKPGDVPEGEDVSAWYSRGVAVYQ
jgi:hypothetical protein